MSASLITRISRRVQSTHDKFQNDCHFSSRFAWLRVLDELGGRLHMTGISHWAHAQKDEWMLNYLSNVLKPVLDQYSNQNFLGTEDPGSPIWVFWWDGAEAAPLLVQRCIKSISAHSGNHQVNILSKENLEEFIEIPEYIRSKRDSGKMGFAHFADYVRAKLLWQYGGLWLDATIFASQAIPDQYFHMPFFTCKSPNINCAYISGYRWCTFCLGSWKKNILLEYLVKSFEQYWSTQDSAIDYLFFDYIFVLGYEHVPSIKKLIDDVPFNNLHRDDLQAAMNAALPAEKFNTVLNPDTVLYKLSWRETYSQLSPDGSQSIYSFFLNI